MNKVDAKKQLIIEKLTAYLIMHGLNDVGLRTLASVSDTSDRMLIYYFETKDKLIGVILNGIAQTLAQQLDMILGEHQRDRATLQHELVQLGRSPEFSPMIRLWFEVVGLAVRDQEPYATYARIIAANWLEWMESRLNPKDIPQAKEIFAEIEGRLMLYFLGVAPD